MIFDLVPDGDEVAVHLVTQADPEFESKQSDFLGQIEDGFAGTRVAFTWEFDRSPSFHARSITTDTGWKITLDRGLDIWQRFEGGHFSAEVGIQEARMVRGAEITYLRV